MSDEVSREDCRHMEGEKHFFKWPVHEGRSVWNPFGTVCSKCGKTLGEVLLSTLDERDRLREEKRAITLELVEATNEATRLRAKAEGPYRVACDNHNQHKPIFTDGRPLLDDRCPWCLIEQLEQEGSAFANGVESVLMIRCVKHHRVPQINKTEIGGGECGACVAGELRARNEKLERVLEAAEKLSKKNIVGIYDGEGEHLYPEFVGVVREDYNNMKDAIAAAEKGSEPR